MGGSKSKALYNAPSARVVLARRQQEMEAVASNLSKAPVAPSVPAQPAPSAAPRIPINVVPPVHSETPQSNQAKASGYDENVPLSPDILREVAKWNVVKTHTMNSKTSEAPKVKSAVEVRQELEKSEAAEGPKQGAKLSELQIHELFKSMRDQPTTAPSELAAKYNISEEDIKVLQSFARYPIVVVDPDDAQSKIAY